MRTGPPRTLLLAALVLLAGCSGPAANIPDDDPTADGEVRYGLAVESDYPGNRTFTLRVLDDDQVVLNRSKRLAPGERWHVANMSNADYAAERYTVQVSVEGGGKLESSVSFRESDGVNRVSGASLVVLGAAASAHHTCAGNVTCYEAVVD